MINNRAYWPHHDVRCCVGVRLGKLRTFLQKTKPESGVGRDIIICAKRTSTSYRYGSYVRDYWYIQNTAYPRYRYSTSRYCSMLGPFTTSWLQLISSTSASTAANREVPRSDLQYW